MKKKYASPERYFFVSLICLILLFCIFFRTDSWTGDKPFSEFTQRDWTLFVVFLIEEFIIICAMVVFLLLGNKKFKNRNAIFVAQSEMYKFIGIKPGDYDYVWFDFANTERALILKKGDQFMLYVQTYNEHTGEWEFIGGVSVYDSLETVKIALHDEFEFYCHENTELDKYGVEKH